MGHIIIYGFIIRKSPTCVGLPSKGVLRSKKKMYNREEREMHKATCADCNQECEVPFKPDPDRPVYCRECFQKHRPPRRY
jgi:CxxC-x17-CxxC domain-containing protein